MCLVYGVPANGPIDAIMKAVKNAAAKIFPFLNSVEIVLEDWRPVPITKGTEAMGGLAGRNKKGPVESDWKVIRRKIFYANHGIRCSN
jgi:hypothetical protein